VIFSRKDVAEEQDVTGASGVSDASIASGTHEVLDQPVPGDSEHHVLDCPVCASPITRRMTRCPGCDTFLILGYWPGPARSIPPAGLVAGGLVIGLVIGLVVMITFSGSPSASAGESAGPSAAASADLPGPRPVKAPAGAAAALTGTLAVNRRIEADSDALRSTLRKSRLSSADIASGVRVLAADAVVGLDLVGRLAPWTEARPVMSDLAALYRSVSDEASAALRISYSNERAYRNAAKALLKTLDRLQKVDATAQKLAASVGLVPASPGASSTP
jgi:hypothetical protein